MSQRKTRTEEKNHLNNKLVKYSTAAGAAVALANPAAAGIEVLDVSGWSLQLSGLSDNQSFQIDLNGDSATDATFFGNRNGFTTLISYPITTTIGSYVTSITGFYTATYSISGAFSGQGAGANAFATTGGSMRKLSTGSGVQSALNLGNSGNPLFFTTTYTSGGGGDFDPGAGGSNAGYIGLSFDISGNTHYAWLEILLSRDSAGRPFEMEVLSGAYEDVAGEDIQAAAVPEPASVGLGLGLLALGAAGVRRMRQREQ